MRVRCTVPGGSWINTPGLRCSAVSLLQPGALRETSSDLISKTRHPVHVWKARHIAGAWTLSRILRMFGWDMSKMIVSYKILRRRASRAMRHDGPRGKHRQQTFTRHHSPITFWSWCSRMKVWGASGFSDEHLLFLFSSLCGDGWLFIIHYFSPYTVSLFCLGFSWVRSHWVDNEISFQEGNFVSAEFHKYLTWLGSWNEDSGLSLCGWTSWCEEPERLKMSVCIIRRLYDCHCHLKVMVKQLKMCDGDCSSGEEG